MDDERKISKYFFSYAAVTVSNQPISQPGPSDYAIKKPLPQTATIATTREQRNLYKPFEPNPGPGTY